MAVVLSSRRRSIHYYCSGSINRSVGGEVVDDRSIVQAVAVGVLIVQYRSVVVPSSRNRRSDGLVSSRSSRRSSRRAIDCSVGLRWGRRSIVQSKIDRSVAVGVGSFSIVQ